MENPNKSYLEKSYPSQERFSNKTFQGVCELHNELFNNYCVNLECLKALCSECIEEHMLQHERNNTKAEIPSLKKTKMNCSRKVQAGITSLTQEVKKCELDYILDPDALIEEGTKKIKKFKERLVLMIESHCANLEESLKRRVHENLLKFSDFEGIFDKMKNILAELDYLKNSLENQNPMPIIQKICLLDLKALMNKFKGEISSVAESKELEPIDVHVDEMKFMQFRLDLENMLYIQRKNENETKKEKTVIENKVLPQTVTKEDIIKSKKNGAGNVSDISEAGISRIEQAPMFKPPMVKPHPTKTLFSNYKINMPNYFQPQAQKLLHFFYETSIFFLDLEQLHTRRTFNQTNLKISFIIPSFHKSIIIPNGDIYLIGGTFFVSDQEKSSSKSNAVYFFNKEGLTLDIAGKMNDARSSHSICFLGDYIYVLGGYGMKQDILSSFERFNCQTKKVDKLANMLTGIVNASICSFNGSIFKFGGFEETINQKTSISNSIVKYDLKFNRWTNLSLQLSLNKYQLTLLSTSASLQINENEIIVVGGYHEDNSGSDQTFIAQVNKPQNSQENETVVIKDLNLRRLPFGEGFWNNNPFIQEGKAFFMQNKSGERDDICLEDDRTVLVLDKDEWNIVNQSGREDLMRI